MNSGYKGKTKAQLVEESENLHLRLEELEKAYKYHQQVEESLRESEEFNLSLLENSPNPIIVIKPDSSIKYVNPALEEIAGFSSSVLIGEKTPYPWWTEETLEKTGRDFQKAMREGAVRLEELFKRKNGERFWVEITSLPITKDGELKYYLANWVDITERKRAEEALCMERDRAQQYLDLAGVIFVAINSSGEVTLINRKGLDILGYEEGEVVGRNWFDNFLPEELRENIKTVSQRIIAGEIKTLEYYENPILTKSGEERLIAWHNVDLINEVGNIIGHLSSGEDITERRLAEKALKESEERYRSIFETVPSSIILVDKDGQIVDLNPYHLTHTAKGQVPSEDFIGKNIVTHPTIVNAGLSETYKGVLEGESFDQKNVYFPSVMSGEDGYFNVKGTPLFRNGEVIGAVITHEDITDCKRIEEALRESEARYRTLCEASFEGILIHDKGVVIDANSRLAEMSGYEVDELIGMNGLNLIAPEHREMVGKKIALGYEEPYEALGFRKDSSTLFVEIQVRQMEYRGRQVRISAVRDITERKRMEEKLQKADKLEAIGILAGGIAHDFNNILQALWGNITLAKMNLEPESKSAGLLAESEKACSRAASLTQQLLTFAKGGLPVKKVISIGDLLKKSVDFALHGSGVKCVYSIPDNLWLMELDEGQINQVINNLIINADQAMPDGGAIKVSAENFVLDAENKVLGIPLDDGKYVKISFEDQGIGIKKDHLLRIFDPYFTTKQSGSGLGLAISYSIIDKHDGHINVKSEVGKGCTFEIYLPVSETSIRTEVKKEAILTTGNGKILFMDDDEQLKKMVDVLLKRFGYEVEFASDGAEAIEMYKKAEQSKEPFDVVILDLTVPGGMGGKECIKKLMDIDPDIKAIVSSGYSTDPIIADFRKYGFCGMIAKPYRIQDLGEELHKIIVNDRKRLKPDASK